MFCAKCGVQIEQAQAFCGSCGNPTAIKLGEPKKTASRKTKAIIITIAAFLVCAIVIVLVINAGLFDKKLSGKFYPAVGSTVGYACIEFIDGNNVTLHIAESWYGSYETYSGTYTISGNVVFIYYKTSIWGISMDQVDTYIINDKYDTLIGEGTTYSQNIYPRQ